MERWRKESWQQEALGRYCALAKQAVERERGREIEKYAMIIIALLGL